MLKQIDLKRQSKDSSLNWEKLELDFLNGNSINLTNGNNNGTLTGLADPTLAQDVATKSYVDGLVDASLKAPEAYDASINSFPTTYDGEPIQKGDSYRITVAGTLGSFVVNAEDLLIALTDLPTATDWMVAESNRSQATESTLGVARLATQAENYFRY